MLPSTRTAMLAFVTDLVLVLVFVLIGRASHDAGPVAAALTTLWPFATGLIVGWTIGRVWRSPLDPIRSGFTVWLVTVVVEMLLRAMSGQGTALSFVIVTTVVLGLFLVGWRLIAQVARWRRRERRRHPVADVGGRQ